MKWGLTLLLGLGLAWAAPFLGTIDKSGQLEKFQATAFCKQYRCEFRTRTLLNQNIENYAAVFALGNKDIVQIETLGKGQIISIQITLVDRVQISPADIALMRQLTNLAAGRAIAFDYANICRGSTLPYRDYGKVGEYLFRVECKRDSSGFFVMKAYWPG